MHSLDVQEGKQDAEEWTEPFNPSDEALRQSWVTNVEGGVQQLQRMQRKKDQSLTCSLGMFSLETGSTD